MASTTETIKDGLFVGESDGHPVVLLTTLQPSNSIAVLIKHHTTPGAYTLQRRIDINEAIQLIANGILTLRIDQRSNSVEPAYIQLYPSSIKRYYEDYGHRLQTTVSIDKTT